jgi:undecaprenyl-diphosphatase
MLDLYERMIFGGLLVVFLCGWSFLAIAANVVDGDTQSLDERILISLRTPGDPHEPLGSESWQEVGRDLTALGGYAFLTLLLLGVCGFLLLAGRRQMMGFLLLSVVGAYLAMMGLKSFYQRPRPELISHFSHVETSSFPSGHSMMSMVVFLTLGALLARISKSMRLKIYCVSFALLLSLLVGCSRVYVGVHYPSDVLAGWSMGVFWATLSCLAASWFERRGVGGLHEPAAPGDDSPADLDRPA